MRLSKYKDMDGGQLGLMPMMIADPTRVNGGSLSYNNMLMRQDGSVMTKDHIKELRERQGFCLTCQGEPVQLFEIKKSKINPLFRGKEALDALHQSHNGICLKCNPRMDPHRLTRRESIRMLSRNSSVRSMRSMSSRSRSSSPSPPTTPNNHNNNNNNSNASPAPKLLAKKRNDLPRNPANNRRRSKVMAEMQSLDLFSNLARKNSIPFEQPQTPQPARGETPVSGGGGSSTNSTLSQPSPGESVTLRTPGSINSLGSLIQSNKVPINRSQIEEFSMPDFSEESTSFKSHRKKTKKKIKETSNSSSSSSSSSRGRQKNAPTTSNHNNNNDFNINAALSAVSEENSSRASSRFDMSQGSDNLFADFSDPFLGTANNRSRSPPMALTNRRKQQQQRRASYEYGGSTARHDGVTEEAAFGNSSLFFEDIKGSEDVDQNQNPFSSSSGESLKLMGSSGEWSAAFGDRSSDGDDDDDEQTSDSWPAAPSIATTTDSRKTMRGSNASEDGSFLAPPSQTSSVRSSSRFKSVSREPSEQSISLQDAVMNLTIQDDFSNSMSPSQLIQADELLMSGISKTEFASDFASVGVAAAGGGFATSAFEISMEDFEEIKTLLQDVAAGGNSEIMIDMLAGTIREHKKSIMVQELCLKHIWEHSKFNEAHKAHVMEAGLGQDVVYAMKTHRKSAKIQEYACGCLWSLSVSKMNRIALARAGAVKLLFRALEEFIDDEEVLETVFGALRTLSPEKEVREAMVPILGPRRVCRAMANHRSSTSIQRDGCAFLSNVAVDMENQMVSVVTVGEIAAVVRALGDHLRNESVVSSACFALKNYTYEEKNLRALRRFDEATSLLEDASKYSTKAEIRVEADEIRERLRLQGEEDDTLEAIAYSSLIDAMDNREMTVEQAVETIRDVLKQYEWSEKLICYGVGSLLSLSRQSQEYLTRITQFDVLKTIVHTMYKQQDNANVQERGCETLKFLAQQGNRPRTMICDVDGSSILIAALRQHQENESVRGPAVGALEELSKDPRCAQLIQVELVGGPDAPQQQQHGNSLSSLGA